MPHALNWCISNLICEGWEVDEQLPFGARIFSSWGDHAEKFEVNNFRGISVSDDWKFHVSTDKTKAHKSTVAVAAVHEWAHPNPCPYSPDVTPYNDFSSPSWRSSANLFRLRMVNRYRQRLRGSKIFQCSWTLNIFVPDLPESPQTLQTSNGWAGVVLPLDFAVISSKLLQMPHTIQCICFTGHYSHMHCILCIVFWCFIYCNSDSEYLLYSIVPNDSCRREKMCLTHFSSSVNNLNILWRETGKENVLNPLKSYHAMKLSCITLWTLSGG